MTTTCPCQSAKPFSLCCEPLLTGDAFAETAKALMRSRYTAYAMRNTEYLLRTWHPSTRPEHIAADTIPDWCGLIIKNSEAGGLVDTEGVVEFIATARVQNDVVTLHEISSFQKEDGQWLYVDGEVQEQNKTIKNVGRNAPCPCGSGNKFKRCCNQ